MTLSWRADFRNSNPEVIGSEYLVLGTVDMKLFKASLAGQAPDIEALLASTADFADHMKLNLDPGGIRRTDADPEKYIVAHEKAEAGRKTPWTRGCSLPPPGL